MLTRAPSEHQFKVAVPRATDPQSPQEIALDYPNEGSR